MKKNLILLSLGVILLTSCDKTPQQTAAYEVVPLPASIELAEGQGEFILSKSTVIACSDNDPAMHRNAELLAEYLETMTGHKLKITEKEPSKNAIVLSANLQNDNYEAYALNVTPDLITINGASPAGAFYGIQTLRKSIPSAAKQNVAFPAVTIADQPRFAYRGTHFDVSRHFFPVDSIKAYIDILALHNVNKFHWHLTDDQGWRIEIKKRPELAELGSKRIGTAIGHDFNSCDSIPVEGYYTQEEAKEIVKYAADRHITVIPEIDMPGHMLGALKAYPELGCTGGPYEVWTIWGVTEDVLCAGNDSVYAFIDDVLDEITEIFPSEYIHIGGDECPKTKWKECKKCQAKIKALGLKSDKNSTAEQKLQTYFMTHAAQHLAEKGRKIIGWDEILEGGLTPGAIIMSWRGFEGAEAAAKAGHDAIMTPVSYCYFDYLQEEEDKTDEIKLPYRTLLTLEKVYSMEPIDSTFTPEEAAHILGPQANLWTEYVPTFSYAQYKLLPRLAAMCEVQWVEPGKKDFSDFQHRMQQMTNAYDAEGYNYAPYGLE